jgi:hypothetical protein
MAKKNDNNTPKRGRGALKALSSPEELWSYFEKYKVHTKKNPIKVEDWVGGMAKKVVRKRERPLTTEGFENYLSDLKIITDLSDYFENKEQRYSDFVHVCSRIKKEIRQDQIEGGMANLYNASITQRLNNLVDKSEHVIREQPLFGEEKEE